MMKTKKCFGFAALVCGMTLVLASCAKEDNPANERKTVTIGFENQALNEDGFWCGGPSDIASTYLDEWGSMVSVFTNVYEESVVKVWTVYSVSTSEYGTYDYWSGFAFSSRTETSFAALTLTPDQYNNVVGSAHTGKNFLVAQYTYNGESITMPACKVKGFWYTNSAYTVNSILNGDNYSGAKFDASDWLTCTITGTRADGSTATVDIDLASNGDYVKEWKYCDLSSLGVVTELSFSFSGSRNNAYGLLTPAYICVDDLTIEY